MDNKLIKEIIKTSNAIRKKYKALKTGRIETETQLEETFKPITSTLKELTASVKLEPKGEIKPKEEERKMEKADDDDDEIYTPPARKYLKMEATSTPFQFGESSLPLDDDDDASGDEDADDEFATPIRSSTLKERSLFTVGSPSQVVNKYKKLVNDNSSYVDNTYGVYHSGGWKIGNSTLKVANENIVIKDKQYKITEGLFELLFMKRPKGYTQEDLSNYQIILKDTSAHKRNFKEDEQIKGTNSHKYKSIIKKLVHTTKLHKGTGIMRIPNKNIDYVYWDDSNELVDRLRILIASQQAGNNSHTNEIIVIIEELREKGIIR